MGWNEPGGGRDNDPWGGRRKEQGPPNLDEVVRKLQEKFKGILRGGRGSGRGDKDGGAGAGALLLLVLGLWVVYDMSYIIQEAEQGVVLRFGRYVDTIDPGLNFRLPRPIEYVHRVDVKKIDTLEIGFRKGVAGGQTSPVLGEALMLSQDENIVDVQLAVQHQVKDARDYLFNVRDPEKTLRQSAESAIRETIGKNKLDFIITEGRTEIAAATAKLLQTILDRYQTGILITNVNMQNAQAPQQVQPAFDDAAKAREDKVRQENEAEAYANDIIPRARGGAARQIEEARAYRDRAVAEAEGEANRFLKVLKEYEAAPAVTRERLYLETVEAVLHSTPKVMVDVEGGNNLLYLPLDKLLESHTTTSTAPLAAGSEDGAAASKRESDLVASERRRRLGGDSRVREVR